METLLVSFKADSGDPIDRGVLIDDQPSGRTNQKLMVQKGHHKISLAAPDDYTPAQHDPDVKDTTPDRPMEVAFVQTAAPAAPGVG